MVLQASRTEKSSIPGVVIIGGGTAGINAALACRKHYPDKQVTIVDGEEQIGYYRTLLSHYMAGKLEEEALFFWRPGEDPLLRVRLNERVRSLDREKRRLHLDSGESLTYERLVLTTGGRPFVPPVCRHHSCRLGVFPVRDLTVARAVRRWLPGHRNVTVLGGGLVGVKTAVQLAVSGFPVVLVERENRLLPNILTSQAAGPLAGHLRETGIDVRLRTTIDEIRGGDLGDLEQVKVSGKWLGCDTLLVAIGSTPELEYLKSSGILEDSELIVTPALQTMDPKVFAAGDAVVIKDSDGTKHMAWTWPQAVSQGRLAGVNIYRPAPLGLQCLTRVNAQNIAGLSLAAFGLGPAGSDTVARPGQAGNRWREMFVADHHFVGGALVGDISGAGPMHAKIIAGKNVGDNALELLKPWTGAFAGAAWKRLGQNKTVRFFSRKGNVQC